MSKFRLGNLLIYSGALLGLFILAFWAAKFLLLSAIAPQLRPEDGREMLPNKVQYEDAKEFFNEQSLLTYTPRSFVMHEVNPFKGKYINIEKVANETVRVWAGDSVEDLNRREVWFFGGSTMFGDSSPDKDTIPAIYHSLTGKSTLNFGVGAYNSRHNLNRLLNLLSDKKFSKPNRIIFYDGVNNVVASCFTTLDYVPQSYREDKLHELYRLSGNKKPLEVDFFLRPFQFLLRPFTHSTDERPQLGWEKCIDQSGRVNEGKLKLIAESLCNDWMTARQISTRFDVNFVAVLQPHLWSSIHHRKEHLPNENSLQGNLYTRFYEIFKSACPSHGYLDASGILDGEDFYFVDSVHLSPKGNYLIASFLSRIRD